MEINFEPITSGYYEDAVKAMEVDVDSMDPADKVNKYYPCQLRLSHTNVKIQLPGKFARFNTTYGASGYMPIPTPLHNVLSAIPCEYQTLTHEGSANYMRAQMRLDNADKTVIICQVRADVPSDLPEEAKEYVRDFGYEFKLDTKPYDNVSMRNVVYMAEYRGVQQIATN